MSNNGKWDLARQVATVVGALFQVLAPAIVPIGAIAKETPSLLIPADYAFAIWGPIRTPAPTITPAPISVPSGSALPPLLGLRYLPGTTRQ